MKQLLSTLGTLFSLIVGLCLSSPNLAAATLTIDKEDFPPGAFAIIDGAGFEAGEEVVLTVIHVNDPNDPAESWTERADENGAFITFWYVNENALNDTLLLTAVGQSSGLTAEKTFTDAAAVGTFSASFNTTSGTNPGSYNVVLTINNINTGVAATTDDMHAVQVTIPAGASVTWGTVSAFNAANSPLTWDQTPNVIAAGVYGFTRNNSATTKVPAGGKVTIAMTINVSAASSCFGIGAFGNNGYGQAFSGNGSTLVCFGLTNPGVAPSFTVCPINPTASTSGACSAVVNYTATANGAPAPTLSYVLSGATTGSGSGTGSGSAFNVGTTTVTVTASNATGSATCVFTVTVSDTEAPSIASVPAGGSAAADASCQATIPDVVTGTSASDNCTAAGSLTITQSPAAGTIVGVDTHTIVVTVTDAAGNSSSASTTFTVSDTTNPTISAPADVTVSTDAGQCSATGVALGSATSGDNCPGSTVSNDAPTSYPVGPTTVTWTVTDASGNTATDTQVVTVTDNENPTISAPADVTVSADAGQCSATGVSLGSATSGDNCPGSTVSNDAPTSYPVGPTTVTWTVTDASGNTATDTQVVTVTDNENPTISAPADVTVSADAGQCSATGVALGSATSGDNCPGSTVSNDAPTSYPVGPTTVTWTVTDASGNTATDTQVVTVTDNENPTISAPADVTVSADAGQCSATGVSLGSATSGDNCPGSTVSNDAPTSYPVGPTTVTWTVTDASGNTATDTQVVTVTDNENPTISAPADVTVSADAGQCSATGVALGSATSGDNCPGSTVSNDAPTSYPVGPTTVTWTVTDASGNTATDTQVVTVTDNENPTISAPADVTVSTDAGQCSATGVALGSATSGDNCPGSTVSNDAPTSYPVGPTTVTWTVTDASGNTATDTQVVTVTDNENPTITAPADVTVSADAGQCSATGVALGSATSGDNCPGSTVSNDAPTSYPVGPTTVTWTVTDASGNTATDTQVVTVTDNENPTISAPADVTVSADAGQCSATGVALGSATSGDNCPGSTVSNDAPTSYPVGSTTVTWTVTDASGNTATDTQVVTVTDNENPTITAPADVTVSADAGQCSATGVSLGSATSGDNCPGSTVSNDAPTSFPVGPTTVTWTVTDASGNTATDTQVVTVTDDENPTISISSASAVADPGQCYATGVSLGSPTTGDNCGVASVTNDAPSQFPVGPTTVTWTVTDVHGNSATTAQVVTVTDTQNPTITAPAATSASADAGQCYATGVSLGSPVTGDNCGVASVGNNAPAQFPVGATLVTWTVTDVNGNSATASQLVTVTDNENPVITCPANITVSTLATTCNRVVTFSVGATDNCPGVSVVSTPPSGSTFPIGTTTVNSVATDAAGNQSACSFTVTVVDNTAPTIVTKPATVQLVNGAASITLGDINNGSSDNCPGLVLSLSRTTFGCGDVGPQTVTLSGVDAAGNTASATAIVTVLSQVSEVTGRDSIYTGSQTFWTTSETSSTASLALSATIRTECGDITLAKVRFYISDKAEGPWTAATGELNVGPVANAVDRGTGSASATVQYNIGNNNAITLYVKVGIGGCFLPATGCNTISPISVSKPGTGRTTGMVKISNTSTPAATGILATSNTGAALTGRSEVAMGVWYNRSGANPQGGVSGIICAGGRTYSYKSTAISTFSVKVGAATFSSKCVLKDITDPNNPISLDSGNMMQFTVTDGSPDKASLVINRSSSLGGGIWYSSAWQNSKTVEKPVSTGNMTITP